MRLLATLAPYLGLQVNVGQGHLRDLVETDGERDGTEHEERVIDGHAHGHDGLPLPASCLHQHGAGEVHQQEDEADEERGQVEGQPGGRGRRLGRHDLQVAA